MDKTLSSLLAGGRNPAAVIATDGEQGYCFGRFRAAVAANALALRQAGIRRGLLLSGDSYQAAVGLYAMMTAGCAVIFPPNGRPGTLDAMADSFDCVVSDGPQPAPGTILLRDGEDADVRGDPLQPSSPVSFFTSGSTGSAKRIDKTLGQLQCEAAAIETLFAGIVQPDACVQATVSHQHVYGLAFRLCWPLATGRPFAAQTHDLWESALAALQGGDVLVTSPAHLLRLDGLPPLPADRRPSLILSAGAPLPQKAVEGAQRVFGLAPTEIFGSTETGAIAWRHRDRDDPPWQPLPGVMVGVSAEGCLEVQAPHVAGRQSGADRIALLTDGTFRFHGRADRVVKVGGRRVDLQQVEQLLRDLPWVTDAAVIMLDADGGIVAAVVTCRAGREQLEHIGAFRFGRLLRQALSTTIEPAGLPRRWRFVDSLPLAALGKRRQEDIAALFSATRPEDAQS